MGFMFASRLVLPVNCVATRCSDPKLRWKGEMHRSTAGSLPKSSGPFKPTVKCRLLTIELNPFYQADLLFEKLNPTTGMRGSAYSHSQGQE